jgi:DNA-binding NtrC family response regulator
MSARVLLVDDNPFDRELAAWALGKIPCPPGPIELICAASWDEARLLLAPGDVDLLLLDYRLPGCTGLEILRTELATRRPRVIVVTGHDDVRTAVATMREGAFDYVPKGLDWSEALTRSVTQALERPAS